MKRLAVANQERGAGRTTSAICLAVVIGYPEIGPGAHRRGIAREECFT